MLRKEGRRQKLSSDAAAAVRQDDALLEGRQTNGFPRNNFADAPGARLRRKKERVGMRERQGQRENGGRRRRLPPLEEAQVLRSRSRSKFEDPPELEKEEEEERGAHFSEPGVYSI